MARIRRAFVAPPGHLLMSIDFSQLGLHLLAHLTKAAHCGPNDESVPVVLDEPFLRIAAERKWELLDMTLSCERYESLLMRLSAIPSERYSWPGSSLRLTNGKTARAMV